MLHGMAATRVYTQLDDLVNEALERASRSGLVPKKASRAQKLHALVEVANETLRADEEREEKIAAYQELAADTNRADAIREANLAAVGAGII
jgi:hypothetical protein